MQRARSLSDRHSDHNAAKAALKQLTVLELREREVRKSKKLRDFCHANKAHETSLCPKLLLILKIDGKASSSYQLGSSLSSQSLLHRELLGSAQRFQEEQGAMRRHVSAEINAPQLFGERD